MSKKLFLSLAASLVIGFSTVFATGYNPAENTYTFKSADEEVALDVQRGTGEVKLHILVKDMGQYDHIIIERSAETPNYFGKCRYILCADAKSENGYMLQIDRYPYSANKDVYYRIKTVTKDGIERAYPAVLLASIP